MARPARIALTAFLAGTLAVQPALAGAAETTCEFSGGMLDIRIEDARGATILDTEDGYGLSVSLNFDVGTFIDCGDATHDNTSSVTVTAGDGNQHFGISAMGQGQFGNITQWTIDLGEGSDTFYAAGTKRADSLAIKDIETEGGTIAWAALDGTTFNIPLIGVEEFRLYGGKGPDRLLGDSNPGLILYGSKGDDRLIGGRGNDALLGDEGDDVLLGEGDSDELSGGDGRDRCNGGPGRDVAADCEIRRSASL